MGILEFLYLGYLVLRNWGQNLFSNLRSGCCNLDRYLDVFRDVDGLVDGNDDLLTDFLPSEIEEINFVRIRKVKNKI